MIASCRLLEDELLQCSKEEGVTIADSVETLEVDLRTRVKKLGAKGEARRKKCKVRFSLVKKNKAFQKNYMKVEPRSCYERVWCQQGLGEFMQWGSFSTKPEIWASSGRIGTPCYLKAIEELT